METRPVVIIGAKGMLGSMLAQVFADRKPVLLDREELDITNQAQVQETIQNLKPGVIINAAAYTAVDAAETNHEAAVAVNAQAVANLAVAAKKINAILVHYSTDYVFPGDTSEGYMEDAPTGPAVNFYGESKLAGEQALTKSGADFYLLRTAWLYGPNGKNFVATMLKLAAEKPELGVIHDQVGSPTFTKDVALFTKALLDDQAPFGIYHAVNSGQASWYDFTKEIFRLKNVTTPVKPITSADFPLPAQRPAFSCLKSTKRPALRPWQEALKEYLLTI